MSFTQLIELMMRPLNQDFSDYLSAYAEAPSSKHLPMSDSSKATLARLFNNLILNALKNREIRRTYNMLTKGKGLTVLRLIMPRKGSCDQTLNLS